MMPSLMMNHRGSAATVRREMNAERKAKVFFAEKSNPLSLPSQIYGNGSVVQLVRMPPCHGGGRGFESRPDRKSLSKKFERLFLFYPLSSFHLKSLRPTTKNSLTKTLHFCKEKLLSSKFLICKNLESLKSKTI